MEALVAVMGACGLLLLFLGATAPGSYGIDRRVEPFLPGSGQDRRPRQSLWSRVMPADKALHKRLLQAGVRTEPAAFRAQQLTSAVVGMGCAISWLLLMTAAGRPISPGPGVALVLIGAATGWVAREHLLSRTATRRAERLEAQLPTAVDLLALCLTAGEALPAALGRVAAAVGGDLGEELELVVADVRAGSGVDAALAALSARVDLASFDRVAVALITALERGTPLAEMLRAHANDVRETRRQRLVESAGRREILMLVPVVFLILPVTVLFALFPGLAVLDLLVK